MRPKLVIHTKGLVASVLSRLSEDAGLHPLAWQGMLVVDFLAVLRRRQRA